MNLLVNHRYVLAWIAANGIMDVNSAVSMPASFGMSTLKERMHWSEEDLVPALKVLTNAGFLSKDTTGYNGYGDVYVDGHDTWSVTREGLIHLWTNSTR